MRKIKGHLPDLHEYEVGENSVGSFDGVHVGTFPELVKQVAAISYLNKDHLIFFRGQNTDYRNKSGSSTFYPTIFRGDYLSKAELSDRFAVLLGASRILVERFTDLGITGSDELKRKKLIQWSILQHYEICPTPLMDFTHSLRVAASFAQLDVEKGESFVYAFGLPYLTNRISANSEHDLVNIRLLSICPPEALRPYYQEGYLAATEDIETEYDDKTELDFNNRLIAKFRIPNTKRFWGKDFNAIPKTALYPTKDVIAELATRIVSELSEASGKGDVREFLKVWSEIEEYLAEISGSEKLRTGLSRILKSEEVVSRLHPRVRKDIDRLRHFRNKMVHSPFTVDDHDIATSFRLLLDVRSRLYRNDS